MSAKIKTFTVHILVPDLLVDVNIKAASLEDAITTARSYGIMNVLKNHDGVIDGTPEVTGVFS